MVLPIAAGVRSSAGPPGYIDPLNIEISDGRVVVFGKFSPKFSRFLITVMVTIAYRRLPTKMFTVLIANDIIYIHIFSVGYFYVTVAAHRFLSISA